ncbi:MAG: hypothetical protein R3E68_01745 [Burkholderiaceae bacterium]
MTVSVADRDGGAVGALVVTFQWPQIGFDGPDQSSAFRTGSSAGEAPAGASDGDGGGFPSQIIGEPVSGGQPPAAISAPAGGAGSRQAQTVTFADEDRRTRYREIDSHRAGSIRQRGDPRPFQTYDQVGGPPADPIPFPHAPSHLPDFRPPAGGTVWSPRDDLGRSLASVREQLLDTQRADRRVVASSVIASAGISIGYAHLDVARRPAVEQCAREPARLALHRPDSGAGCVA